MIMDDNYHRGLIFYLVNFWNIMTTNLQLLGLGKIGSNPSGLCEI